ncbi:MAG TPA: hypothetical protein VNC40_15850 [Gaiellaceae bacterium]|nr:hypothetical protein [Gaiellaceae bacterium]
MKRLSWDTTAPRRLIRRGSSPQPRPETGLIEAGAELIRVAWEKHGRVTRY